MSQKSSRLSDNSKKPIVISRIPLTWLQHAQNHFNSGAKLVNVIEETFHPEDYTYSYYRVKDYNLVDSCEEQLMYLCLFSHVGMFDCTHNCLNVTA